MTRAEVQLQVKRLRARRRAALKGCTCPNAAVWTNSITSPGHYTARLIHAWECPCTDKSYEWNEP